MTNFRVLDIETTGNTNQELVSYCEIDYTENGELRPVVYPCILPEERILPAATALHGISNFTIDKVRNNPNEIVMYHSQKEAYQAVLQNLIRAVKENMYIIGYNHIKFDLQWLKHNIIRYLTNNDEKQIDKINKLFDILVERSLDVFALAKKVYSKTFLGDLTLSTVYIQACCKNDEDIQNFLNRRSRHDAREDCYTTVAILHAIAKEQYGMLTDHNVITNDEIKTLIEKINTPTLLKTIEFGKYKGQTYEEVYNKDINYLYWLAKNNDNKDVQFTLNQFFKKGNEDLC